MRFDVGLSDTLVVILEPNDETWEKVDNCTRTLLGCLAEMADALYFGGSPKKYNALNYEQSSSVWYNHHKGRPFLINPIFEKLREEGHEGMLAIVCIQPPLDIEDWHDSSLLERTVFLNLGEQGISSCAAEIEAGGGLFLEQLRTAFRRQVRSLVLAGPGFMPLRCQIDERQHGPVPTLEKSGGACRLVLPVESSMTVHLDCFALEPPLLQVLLESGEVLFIKSIEEQWFLENKGDWKPVPFALVPKFAALKAGRNIPCDACEEEHEPGTWYCPENRRPLFPRIPSRTVILCTGNHYMDLSEWLSYPIEAGSKVVSHDGAVCTLSRTGEWQQEDRVTYFKRFNDDVWGFYHNNR